MINLSTFTPFMKKIVVKNPFTLDSYYSDEFGGILEHG